MSVVYLVILMSIGGLISIFILLDITSILAHSQFNKISFKKGLTDYYKSIKLMNIKEFDDSFEINTKMNGGYILNSISFYMKIIDIDTVVIISKSSYQIGYSISTHKKIDDEFKEIKTNVNELPGLIYWYRYYMLDKLIKKTECKVVNSNDVNKIINDQYTVYNRDTKLKQLLK